MFKEGVEWSDLWYGRHTWEGSIEGGIEAVRLPWEIIQEAGAVTQARNVKNPSYGSHSTGGEEHSNPRSSEEVGSIGQNTSEQGGKGDGGWLLVSDLNQQIKRGSFTQLEAEAIWGKERIQF